MNELQWLELEEVEEILNADESSSDEIKQRFKIDNINSLNWALRKIASINANLAEEEALFQSELDRITTWIGNRRDSAARSREFFESLITEYATEQRKKDPKFKASTPYGKISFRKQPPQWEYNDELLVKYLDDNKYDDLVRVKKEPIKAEVKKRFVASEGKLIDQDSGEVIPGVTITERGEKLDIKVEG